MEVVNGSHECAFANQMTHIHVCEEKEMAGGQQVKGAQHAATGATFLEPVYGVLVSDMWSSADQ